MNKNNYKYTDLEVKLYLWLGFISGVIGGILLMIFYRYIGLI